jgi:hypothetical protein
MANSSNLNIEIHIIPSSDGAAFLSCGDHTRIGFERNIGELREWGKTNSRNIFHLEKQTKKFGFFIVTAIRHTKRYQLKCWPTITQSETEMLNISSTGFGSFGWVVPPADVTNVAFLPLIELLIMKEKLKQLYYFCGRLSLLLADTGFCSGH